MLKSYFTIERDSEYELIVKKSKFLANSFYIDSIAEAENKLKLIKKKYPDATHHCYGYILGVENNLQKFSDDGEPGGTAGMPIYKVIDNNKLKNTLVIVTRYFGGTKLGAGGLVRAYSGVASEVIKLSGIIKMRLCNFGKIETDYSNLAILENFIRKKDIIKNIDYNEKIVISVITISQWDKFFSNILNLCKGNANYYDLKTIFYNIGKGK